MTYPHRISANSSDTEQDSLIARLLWARKFSRESDRLSQRRNEFDSWNLLSNLLFKGKEHREGNRDRYGLARQFITNLVRKRQLDRQKIFHDSLTQYQRTSSPIEIPTMNCSFRCSEVSGLGMTDEITSGRVEE